MHPKSFAVAQWFLICGICAGEKLQYTGSSYLCFEESFKSLFSWLVYVGQLCSKVWKTRPVWDQRNCSYQSPDKDYLPEPQSDLEAASKQNQFLSLGLLSSPSSEQALSLHQCHPDK